MGLSGQQKGRRALRACAVGLPWVVALAWVWKAAEVAKGMRQVVDLTAGPEAEPLGTQTDAPLLSVVVAACNEERAIEATVRSLLASRGVPLEVIAVNDRSTDSTGRILDALAGEAGIPGRLKVLHIQTLPEGWLGKPHALAAGTALSRAPYLLFTDGDILFRKDALLRALTYLRTARLDHLALLATPITQTRGERVVLGAIPLLAAWSLRLWKLTDPAARDTLGVGSFTLVRREAYEQVGGWAAVRLEVLEDLRFGWELKRRQGLRQAAAVGQGLLRLHWAAGALGLARNLGKNGFAVFRYRTAAAMAALGGVLVLIFAPLAGLAGPPAARWAIAPYAFALWLLRRAQAQQGRQPAGYLLLYPAGGLLLVYGVLRSVVLTLSRGGVEWRGTRYPLQLLRANAGPLR